MLYATLSEAPDSKDSDYSLAQAPKVAVQGELLFFITFSLCSTPKCNITPLS